MKISTKPMTAKINGRMTPWERHAGRFLRSPDGHPEAVAEPAADASPAAVPSEGDAPPAGAPAEAAPTSILGQATGADAEPPPADGAADAPGDADAPPADAGDEGEGDKGDEANVEPFEGLKAPEGFDALDETALAEATPILRELGADTPEKAQAIIDKFGPVLAGMTERANAAAVQQIDDNRATLVAGWAAEVQADPEMGGANYARTVQLAGTFMDRYFGPKGEKPGDNPHRDFLDDSGLGNNPGLVKAFAKAASEIADGTIHTSDAAQPAKSNQMYDDAFLPPEKRRG